jgi:hypothetical protein
MNLRVAMVVLSALLLPAAVAGATTAPAASTPAVAPAAALGEPAACQTSRASFGLAELAPAPTPLSAAGCGTCSLHPCQSVNVGQLCGFRNGQFGYCQSPLGNGCPVGGLQCQCWYGPLP